jgi:spermidine dehydrogenase
VAGDPTVLGFDEFAPANPNARAIQAFLADCPLSPAARDGVLALYTGSKDFMAGTRKAERLKILARTSYRDFVEKICGLPRDAADFFQGRLNDNFGLGIDAIAAFDAMEAGLPGARGLGIEIERDPHDAEPYIHHFPDGNASIARLLVRSLIPAVAPPGKGMDDVVTARFDYARLDVADAPVRLRLRSTAVVVKNERGGVAVGYVQGGRLHRVRGRRAVVATYASVMPHIVPEMPAAQGELLASNVKTPLLYIEILIRNWQAFTRLGVHNISAPMSFLSTVKLDYPVSLGGYDFSRDPAQPALIHAVHVPLQPNRGLDAREQCRAGRQRLLTTSFKVFEGQIRTDLGRMLGKGGFNAKKDILGITLNRWAHGYSYYWNSLYDDVDAGERSMKAARKKIGRIALASSDTAWDAYAHTAIAEAERAIREIG